METVRAGDHWDLRMSRQMAPLLKKKYLFDLINPGKRDFIIVAIFVKLAPLQVLQDYCISPVAGRHCKTIRYRSSVADFAGLLY